jgi:hypothetical protein
MLEPLTSSGCHQKGRDQGQGTVTHIPPELLFFVLFFEVLRMEPRNSHMLSKCCITKLHPKPALEILCFYFCWHNGFVLSWLISVSSRRWVTLSLYHAQALYSLPLSTITHYQLLPWGLDFKSRRNNHLSEVLTLGAINCGQVMGSCTKEMATGGPLLYFRGAMGWMSPPKLMLKFNCHGDGIWRWDILQVVKSWDTTLMMD